MLNFFRRNKNQTRTRPDTAQVTDLFEAVVEPAWGAMPANELGTIYRAGLLGGVIAARECLKASPQLATLWGRGNREKAAKLVEVCASVVTMTLLQNEPDQDQVCRAVATSIAYELQTDEAVAYAELMAYQLQAQADVKIQQSGGIPLYKHVIQHLRCVRALGKSINLNAIPIPIPSVSELVDKNIVTPDDLLANPEELLAFASIVGTAAGSAKDFYQSNKK